MVKLNGEKLAPLSSLEANDVGLTLWLGVLGEVGEIAFRGNVSGVTSMLICSVDIWRCPQVLSEFVSAVPGGEAIKDTADE